MTAKAYRLTPQAEADLDHIWGHTFKHWSAAQADEYVGHLIAMFGPLASGEKRGRAVDVRPGYLKHPCGAHMIYFRRDGDHIVINRILHTKQDVERHL